MPADLTYREDGSAILAMSEEPAWHGEGFVQVGRRLTRPDLEEVVPEWVAPVEARPVYTVVNGAPAESETHVANVRLATRNGGERTVGIVGRRRYQLVQNLAAFDLAEGIMGLREEAEVASVGLLRDGAVAFLSLYLGEDYLVPGAESEKRGRYLNVVNSFDASYALTAINSDIRIVCTNTLRWNLSAPRKVAVRHTGDLDAKLEHARTALRLADRYAELQAVIAEHLVEEPAPPAYAEEFFARLVPYPLKDGEPVREGRAFTNANALREALHNLYATNPTVEPVHGTRWGLMQAVTYDTNHQQARRNTAASSAQDNRYEALILDDAAPLESRAQRLLTTEKLTRALATA